MKGKSKKAAAPKKPAAKSKAKAKTNGFDKSKLPSRFVSVGPERAPHRSFYYAMGMKEEEI
jgi:hypothetical protein